ncbi:GntR family transcriptional regulator [Rhizohabitans arisaemae]|uniref:GntR family transcriptional regulator n=1 Tax=Rhizohabitans arisaemae TaxID=2720610 RepID=UPI0024B19D06|nr:GntR family transcriptional regulator [Rhizohabitans arisaemae]
MRPDTRDLSEQIAADVRALIMAGLLAPGAELPSVPKAAAQRGVSTTAIQNAWKILKAEGYLVSRTGKGVYVRERDTFVVDAAAYYDPAARSVKYRMLDVREVEPPADVAVALGEDRAVLRHRMTVRLPDDVPVELSWSYYPLSLVAGTPLTQRGKIPGGAPKVLAELGHPERAFTDRLSTRPPTKEESEGLNMPNGVPVLRQFRTVFSDHDRPIEVSIIVKPGHLYELTYHQAVGVTDGSS